MLALGKPNPGGREARVLLVIWHEDPANVFNATKEAFDQVTPPPEMAVEVALHGALGVRMKVRLGTAGGDDVDQRAQSLGCVAVIPK